MDVATREQACLLVYHFLIVLLITYVIFLLARNVCVSSTVRRTDDALMLKSNRALGTRHSGSFLITNPVKVARGLRLVNYDFRDQYTLRGVTHFHVDLYIERVELAASEKTDTMDERPRPLHLVIGDKRMTVYVYLLVNTCRTEFNMLDFLDKCQSFVVAQRPLTIWLSDVETAQQEEPTRFAWVTAVSLALNDYLMATRKCSVTVTAIPDATVFSSSANYLGVEWELQG